MPITTTQIVSQFGAYYLQNRANASRLQQMLFYPSLFDGLFTLTPMGDSNRYESAKSTLDRILQPFQKAFTPIGTLDFKPLVIDLCRVKVDISIFPDDLEKTWLGFMTGLNNEDRKQWPFIRWYMEKHLIPQYKQDMELNEAYLGVAAAPIAGTAGAAGTGVNGVKKIINDLVTGSRITPIVLGAMPSDPEDMVDYVLEFCGGIDRRYRGVPMKIAMDRDHADRFADGVEKRYRSATNGEQNNPGTRVPRRLHTVYPIDSTQGSEKIWATPSENAVRLVKGVDSIPFQMESEVREVRIFGDMYRAYGFPVPEAVFTNDRDLV